MDRVKRIWYLLPMRAAKVQASLRIRAVSPEPSLLAHTSSESRGTFRQKARSLAPLNGWACAVKICHDGLLEDTNSLDAAHWTGAKGFVTRNEFRLLYFLFEIVYATSGPKWLPVVARLDWLRASVQLAGMIRRMSQRTFSDSADQQNSPLYTFLQLRAQWLRISCMI